MLFCDYCGAENSDTATQCTYCHRPLTSNTITAHSSSSGQQQMQVVASAPHSSRQSTPISALQAPSSRLHQKYHILEQIGEGGYASIYKACERENQRLFVAIKAINLEGMSAEQIIDATATFNTELTILSTLDHPAIPTLYDHFTDASHWYLVISFIEGQTLEKYFSTLAQDKYRDPQTICTLLEIALELCNVLMYMHRQEPSVIYRDLKPANIMLGPRKRVTLIDFGIARHFKPGQNRDTIPFGSPGYAAPEQYGKAQTTPRSDIYSLGALLHQMLTGEDPADYPFEFPAIHIITPGLPIELGSFIARMLALNPEQRPTSMLDVQQQLGKAHTALKAHLNHRVLTPAPIPTKIQRRTVLGLGVLGLSALAAASLPALLSNHSQPPAPVAIQVPTDPTSTPVTYVTPDDPIPQTPKFSEAKRLSTWTLPSTGTGTAFADTKDVAYNIVACTDNSVYVLYTDFNRGSNARIIYTGHSRPAKYLSHFYGDKKVASCCENDADIHIWDTATGELIYQVQAPKPVIALSLCYNMLAVACADNTVYLYNFSRISSYTHPVPQYTYPNARQVTALILHLPVDNSHFYVGIGYDDGLVEIWQDDTIITQYEHSGAITTLSCWDNRIASSSADQTVKIYRFTSHTLFANYLGHAHKVSTVTWLTYNALASLDESGEAHIWTIPIGSINLSKPQVTTIADPNYNMSAYIINSQYYLTCLTNPNSLTTYQIY
ncbi:serine/threonine-protein kinase [Ktedonobacter racemifer]|uniref:non-specific serine/threonine protein kinase n=1 Tax=Ktedonobacter racemifer DSM 44963 TaxID=485913 RepID=D6U0N1_KTERA|nr:serine/threonine-protein kinase [Ktedonobacter racemifer]EFH82371.1 serine/threonine protein kinase with WD40 repeats [Ktedonobacter racemifer DSM 44963]